MWVTESQKESEGFMRKKLQPHKEMKLLPPFEDRLKLGALGVRQSPPVSLGQRARPG